MRALKRSLAGQKIVVKYGGAALAAAAGDAADSGGRPLAAGADPVLAALVSLQAAGARPVLVHGGGPELTAFMARLGKQATFVDGLRVTDRETVALAEMVLAGRVNKALVDRLHALGGRAVGLSGKDGGLFLARKHLHRAADGRTVDLGFVGEILAVDPAVIATLHAGGWVPVVASIAPGLDGETYNVNADLAAAALAAAIRADRFLLLTDVPGVLRDPRDPASLCEQLTAAQAREMIASGTASGGMVPKLEACLAALAGGAGEAWILDGRRPAALEAALFGGLGGAGAGAAPGAPAGTRVLPGGAPAGLAAAGRRGAVR